MKTLGIRNTALGYVCAVQKYTFTGSSAHQLKESPSRDQVICITPLERQLLIQRSKPFSLGAEISISEELDGYRHGQSYDSEADKTAEL
ncbi:hypothetical protein GRJ2_002079300 [Grus japonensis]|uniref:Uncharacterized protein n=1 Tax=Grus japonensis TaxID=30415 RepID=A0ABC9XGD2_GRUJA